VSGRTGSGATVLLAAVVVTGACTPDPPLPTATEVDVGVHRLAFRVPEGWRHIDRGREQSFRRDIQLISITDMGPIGASGHTRAIEVARELWREGRDDDAHAVLEDLRPGRAFASGAAWLAFQAPWGLVRGADPASSSAELEEAYTEVLAQVSNLQSLDLETLADAALADLGHDERREVAESRPAVIDGRDGLRVDTWDRLSHDLRRRQLFVVSDDHLLLARTELGRFSEVKGPFEALVGSLRFR